MKVGAFYGKEDLRIERREIPTPGPNQMLVKIDYVGICGTDVEFYRTGAVPPFVKLPMVLGHENVGTVAAVGEGVTDFVVGDRLLCGPPTACEEMCPSCKEGKTNICINGFPNTAGIGGPDGGYAEYYLVRDVKHTMLIKVPDAVDPKDAVLFDVICVSLHGVRKSGFKIGDTVVVSGTGPIGLSAIQFLKAGGAKTVIALGTTSSKEPMLKAYGADYFINSKECPDVAGEVKKILGRPVGADIVFECAGNPTSLATCISCVKPGGKVEVIGTIQDPLSNLVPGNFSITEPTLDFSFVYTPDEVEIYLDMLAAGKVSFPGMVTGIVSLDECVEKYIGNPNKRGQLKVLIDPSL
jgi:threonine dehydrogenase-like Zn-dependent dehydrogenase